MREVRPGAYVREAGGAHAFVRMREGKGGSRERGKEEEKTVARAGAEQSRASERGFGKEGREGGGSLGVSVQPRERRSGRK